MGELIFSCTSTLTSFTLQLRNCWMRSKEDDRVVLGGRMHGNPFDILLWLDCLQYNMILHLYIFIMQPHFECKAFLGCAALFWWKIDLFFVGFGFVYWLD